MARALAVTCLNGVKGCGMVFALYSVVTMH